MGPFGWIVFLPVNHGKLIRMHYDSFLMSSITICASFLSQYLITLITSRHVRNNDVDLIGILCSKVR